MTRTQALDKIAKLLRLARGGANPHESALAAERAASLMAQWQVADIAKGGEPSGAWDIVETPWRVGGKRVCAWRCNLLSGICEVYGCRVVWHGMEALIIGPECMEPAIKATYSYLEYEVRAQARNEFDSRAYQNGFRMGAALELKRRLRLSRKNIINATGAHKDALARLRELDREVLAYYNQIGSTRASRVETGNMKGYRAGQEAGRRMTLRIDRDAVPSLSKEGSRND